MNAPNIDLDSTNRIHLKRNSDLHAWTMSVAGEWRALPWADTADAVSVVMWVKSQMTFAGQVHIEL